MENNKKIGLPSSKPPVSISRKKKLTSDMKELYLRRKAHRESLALENEDIKDANRRYYGNPQSMDIRLDNLSTLADKYGVENITTHKKGRSYYRPETKTISINEGQYITSDVELTRRSHRRPHNWEGTALKRGMNKDVVEYDAIEHILLEEIAHAKQQKENTASWQSGHKPLNVLASRIGQPLIDFSSGLMKKTDRKLGKNLYELSSWISGYTRPKALEHEAHSDFAPKLRDSYLQSLDEQNLSQPFKYNYTRSDSWWTDKYGGKTIY